jgi:hypothetical protein
MDCSMGLSMDDIHTDFTSGNLYLRLGEVGFHHRSLSLTRTFITFEAVSDTKTRKKQGCLTAGVKTICLGTTAKRGVVKLKA